MKVLKWAAISIGGLLALLIVIGILVGDPEEAEAPPAANNGAQLEPTATPTAMPSPSPTPTPTPTATPTRTPTPEPQYLLEVQSWRCYRETFGSFGGYMYIEGEVKNISGRPMKNITAVGSWYAANDQLITSDSALIEYNPILPEQTSPFKVMHTLNPAFESCKLGFKELFGGSIRTKYEP